VIAVARSAPAQGADVTRLDAARPMTSPRDACRRLVRGRPERMTACPRAASARHRRRRVEAPPRPSRASRRARQCRPAPAWHGLPPRSRAGRPPGGEAGVSRVAAGLSRPLFGFGRCGGFGEGLSRGSGRGRAADMARPGGCHPDRAL